MTKGKVRKIGKTPSDLISDTAHFLYKLKGIQSYFSYDPTSDSTKVKFTANENIESEYYVVIWAT